MSAGPVSFRGGEIIVLLSNALWTLYAVKAQAWFSHASQLHRTYVASLSALGWTLQYVRERRAVKAVASFTSHRSTP